jgi:hypothetical protein
VPDENNLPFVPRDKVTTMRNRTNDNLYALADFKTNYS